MRVEPERRSRRDEPEAMRLSLNAAMYHSHVFLMSVKQTMASSEMYMLMSPSNLICRARLRTSWPLAVRNISRARSPCPRRRSHDVVRTTPDLRIALSDKSCRSAETSSAERWSSLARNSCEACASPSICGRIDLPIREKSASRPGEGGPSRDAHLSQPRRLPPQTRESK